MTALTSLVHRARRSGVALTLNRFARASVAATWGAMVSGFEGRLIR